MIIAAYDIETTGLLTPDHRIIEVYIGLYRDGELIGEYEQRIDPQRAIAIDAQRVHGITGADLFGKPTWEQVAPTIASILASADMALTHNGEDFDAPFLKQEFDRVKVKMPELPMIDTMKQGLWAAPDGKNPRLEEVCFACGVPYDKSKAHAAAYDVQVMAAAFHRALAWGFITLPETKGSALAA